MSLHSGLMTVPLITNLGKRLLPGLAALVVCACSGDGEGLDVNGRPLASNENSGVGDLESGAGLTFSAMQANVLAPNCAFSGCHSGAAAPVGLRLDADFAYDSLVSVASVQQSDFFRVSPGDPDNSYLIQKLEGTAAVGSQMPRNQPPIPVETINEIRQWIADGAMND